MKQMAIDLKKYRGQDDSSREEYKRYDSLKATHLPKKGSVTVTILENPREVSSDFGDSLVMNVRVKGKTFALWLNEDKPLTKQIIDYMGKTKAEKWKGKTLPLFVAKGKFVNCERR